MSPAQSHPSSLSEADNHPGLISPHFVSNDTFEIIVDKKLPVPLLQTGSGKQPCLYGLPQELKMAQTVHLDNAHEELKEFLFSLLF